MRSLLILGALFGGIAFVVNSAEAQRGPFGDGSFSNPGIAGLVMTNKEVQKELKLTEDQAMKVLDIRKEVAPKVEEAFRNFKDLPKEERGEKMRKVFKEAQESQYKELMAVLSADQLTRLIQIERQQIVPLVLTHDEEVKKELKLTEEQLSKIKTINEELEKDKKRLSGMATRANRVETYEKTSALVKEGNTKAMEVLDNDQKETWKKLTGEPYEVKLEDYGVIPKKQDSK